MLATTGGELMRLRKQLKPGEKRVTILIKPSGFEYRFEDETKNGMHWAGRDIRNAMKLLGRAYRMHKHSMVKSVLEKAQEKADETAKEEKDNGDRG